MLILELLLVWLFTVLVSGTVVVYLCHRWGHDPFGWMLLTMAMGPFAVIAMLGTRQRDISRAGAPEGLPDPGDGRNGIIVAACDGSAATPRIVEHLLARCDPNAEVVLLLVLPHESAPRSDAASTRDYQERVNRMTGAAADLLRERGRRFRTVTAYGKPAEEILRAADACAADLILVGRRGAGLSRALLGSVSDYVVKNADRPVTVVD